MDINISFFWNNFPCISQICCFSVILRESRWIRRVWFLPATFLPSQIYPYFFANELNFFFCFFFSATASSFDELKCLGGTKLILTLKNINRMPTVNSKKVNYLLSDDKTSYSMTLSRQIRPHLKTTSPNFWN